MIDGDGDCERRDTQHTQRGETISKTTTLEEGRRQRTSVKLGRDTLFARLLIHYVSSQRQHVQLFRDSF